MSRAALFLAGLFLALLALARPVDAQLWTLCNSPTQDYCMSFLRYEWEFTRYDEAGGGGYSGRSLIEVELFGSGYDGLGFAYRPYLLASHSLAGCSPVTLSAWGQLTQTGSFLLGDVDGNGCGPGTEPGIYNVAGDMGDFEMVQFVSATDLMCSTREGSGSPCVVAVTAGTSALAASAEPVSVPEPSGALLLVTGLLGLALHRRGRHGDHASSSISAS